jgi:HSP20 family protein
MPFRPTSTAPGLLPGDPHCGSIAQASGRHDPGEASAPAGERRGRGWNPAAHLYSTDATLRFTVELPGITPERVCVSAEHDVLTVHGTRPPRHARSADSGDHPRERHEDEFVYRFGLTPGVDPTPIDAEYADGMLAVHVPNPARFRRTVIRITTAADPSEHVAGAARAGQRGTAARAPVDPASMDGSPTSVHTIW